eukprot:gene25465-30747_t
MSPLSTTELAKLRAFIKGEAVEELNELREGLSAVVKVANASLEQKVEDRFLSACFDLWDVLSQAPHPYRLPRKYIGSSLKETLSYMFRTLYALETVQFRLEAGGNIVLKGVKGVGKTTVLRVAGVIAACLTPSVIPVYWIFEDATTTLATVSTYRIAHAALNTFQGDFFNESIEFSSIVSRTPASNKVPEHKFVFLLDEFTNLYDHGDCGIEVIAEYRRLARNGNVFFVLATSRNNVGKIIFPYGENPSSARYPNLNCGLFSIQEIRPIRAIPDFIAYWQACFDEVIDEATAKRHFSSTGGVGRFIHNLRQRKLCFRPIGMQVFHDDPSLFHLACNLLVGPVATASVRQITKDGDLDRWIDQLVLYSDGVNVHFLLDTVKEDFREYVGQNEILHQAHVFHNQRIGFDGRSTAGGNSNEKFLCRFLPSFFNLRPFTDSLIVTVTADTFSLTMDVSGQTVAVPNAAQSREALCEFLVEYSNRLVSWRVGGSETGIDRIWWRYDRESHCLHLDGTQVKIGRDSMKLTSGVLAAQRGKLVASECYDRTIAGILCKAERGLGLVVDALRKQFGCHIELGSVHICTNKLGSDAFVDFFEKQMKSESYAFSVSPSIRSKYSVPESFLCEIHDGASWINDIVPYELLPFI